MCKKMRNLDKLRLMPVEDLVPLLVHKTGSGFYQIRQSTTSIGVTHRMGVGECLFVTYWLLMYSCISCKLFSFAIVVK